jgi:peptidyl-tRNA hydrolase, PTH1 family
MVRPIFVASLGNPFPYKSTLHSAGHHVLESLRSELGYPGFSRNLSAGRAYTLFRSPAFMNVSGPAVSKAYKQFLSDLPADRRRTARLVILHDELEAPLGKMRMRVGGSQRGHNGLKSVASSLGSQIAGEMVKIGVGIGRPVSREKDDVARFVLREASQEEIRKIQGAAAEVEQLLANVADEDDEG